MAIYKKVKNDIREMKKMAENAEFWMGMKQKENLKKARIFIDKLNFITDLCVYRQHRVIDIDEGKKKKHDDDLMEMENEDEDELEFLNLTELIQEWDNEDCKVCTDDEVNDDKYQILLKNLNAHIAPIIIIKTKNLDQAEDKNCYLKVLEKAYIFLIKFVRNSRQNQLILVEYVDIFMEDLDFGVHAWELVAEIFKNSELLLSYNVAPLLNRVIKLIDHLPKETQKKTTLFSFLQYFLKINEKSIKHLQNVVC